MFEIEFDPAKRKQALAFHKVDFLDAPRVFAGPTFNRQDIRRDYGEPRTMTLGLFQGRMVVVIWTQRGDARRVISMRKANEREQKLYAHRLGQV